MTSSLADSATRAFHIARAADPDYDTHDSYTRGLRAQMARTLALILGLDPVTVIGAPDPTRTYLRGHPGHVFTVTDNDTTYRFAPSIGAREVFCLLGPCLACGAEVPVAEITQLADLGQYITREGLHQIDLNDHRWDPNHPPDCWHTNTH